MDFVPVSPARLAHDLAEWASGQASDHLRIGIDGAAECGATELGDALAAELGSGSRAVVRASTSWWWRPSALRLERGREDVESLLSGWIDAPALRRDLLVPLGPGGSGSYITRLRDPAQDRSIKVPPEPVPGRSVLIVDGPFLLALDLPLDGVIWLQVSDRALARALPPQKQWWRTAFVDYQRSQVPAERADVIVAYDHPRSPAVAGIR